MSKYLLRGGCVLTLGARTPNYAEADVLIDHDRIAEVGQRLRARDAESVDATDTIVMPGFVDTHRHVWKSLFRNLGDGPLDQGVPYGADDLYAATLVGLLGALEAGITSVVDWSDTTGDPAHAEAALQAHADSGLRTVLARPPTEGGDGAPGADGLATHALALDDPEAADWDRLRSVGARIHAHAGVDPAQAGLVADLGARGLLGSHVTLVHCTHLSDGDLDAVASSGTMVALTPATAMAVGMGWPPMQKLLDRRIRPGLGVDHDQVAPGDIFAQMRAAISLQHARHFDLKLAGKAGLPNLLTTREVIRYATIDAARVAGLAAVAGSLEPGKQADLILLRTDRPNISPVNDPIGAVVWGMDTSNVDRVFVAGRPLMESGRLLTDVERARRLAIEARERLSGLTAVTAAGME